MRLPYFFKQQVKLPAKASYVYKWHARVGAFQRLSPPWDKMTLIRKDPGLEAGNQTHFTLHKGPFRFRWIAEHIDDEPGEYFVDLQLKGPFRYWRHSHRFRELDSHHSLMEDYVRYLLPGGSLVNTIFKKTAKKALRRLFRYRGRTLSADLNVIHSYPKKAKKILIAGASGFIGQHLTHFLRASGHEVWFLSRKDRSDPYAIHWDPKHKKMDSSLLEGFHAIYNFSGANIGKGRWTAKRKKVLMESRVESTKLLAKTINQLTHPPEVFINASAVGYYGFNSENPVDEQEKKGEGFLAEICKKWEESAHLCEKARVVTPRFGIVLNPDGGALAKMLPAFRFFLGGKFGNGQNIMSWIALDDLLYALYHLMMTPDATGAFNLTSPNAVTNAEFVKTLGEVLHRPYFMTVPKIGIRSFFGQMGKETLLSSTNAVPAKLLASGFTFYYPELEKAFCHMLGVK